MKTNIVVTYSPGKEEKNIYHELFDGFAPVDYLTDHSEDDRTATLNAAEVIVALSFSAKEIDPQEISQMTHVGFIQLIYAGADNIPFERISERTLVASNTGAFAEPLAEHVLALILALAKNLLPKYKLLCQGQFDRTGFSQYLKGGICGIIGFGGNGQAIAGIMQAVGMKIYGINRSGKTDAPIDFIGDVGDIKAVLQASDVVVVTTPLNRQTRNLIGKQELEWMKKDAVMINVGRGDVINQKALYEHLKAHPDFRAGIDTWWAEPKEHQPFKLAYPFFELPNVIGSPHIADHVPDAIPNATRQALANVKNYLLGKAVRGVVNRSDYLD